MQIGDTIGLAVVVIPEGVTLLDDVEETVVATLSPPKLQAEEEEESRPRPSSSARARSRSRAPRAPRAPAPRAPPARSSSSCDAPLAAGRRGHRLADRRTGQPRPRAREHAAQRGLHGGRGAGRALGSWDGRRIAFAAGSSRAAWRGPSRARPRRPRVAVLCPQTYMNEAGRSVGPARGAFKLALERVLVVHDEIDLPFGEVRTRTGGGLAGHNGLKSIKRELGSAEFTRVRVGVGRPGIDRSGDRLGLRARALPRGRGAGRGADRARLRGGRAGRARETTAPG